MYQGGNSLDSFDIMKVIVDETPVVYASIHGKGITGMFCGFSYLDGTLVVVEVNGLPESSCGQGIHAMHIHEGSQCSGDSEDPYKNTGGHFSMTHCVHSYHTGDLPPLFSNQGFAWMAFYTDKFSPDQINHHTLVIHEKVDDFTSQPSGNAGSKIACGKIRMLYN